MSLIVCGQSTTGLLDSDFRIFQSSQALVRDSPATVMRIACPSTGKAQKREIRSTHSVFCITLTLFKSQLPVCNGLFHAMSWAKQTIVSTMSAQYQKLSYRLTTLKSPSSRSPLSTVTRWGNWDTIQNGGFENRSGPSMLFTAPTYTFDWFVTRTVSCHRARSIIVGIDTILLLCEIGIPSLANGEEELIRKKWRKGMWKKLQADEKIIKTLLGNNLSDFIGKLEPRQVLMTPVAIQLTSPIWLKREYAPLLDRPCVHQNKQLFSTSSMIPWIVREDCVIRNRGKTSRTHFQFF